MSQSVQQHVVDFGPYIPDAVRRAGKLADDLVREQQEQPGPQPGDTDPNPQTDQGQGGEDPPQLNVADPVVQDVGTGQGQGQSDDDWKQRYLSLQGKYNSEVPSLTGQLRVLEGQVGQLQNLLSQVRQQPAPQPQTHHSRIPREVPKEDVEAYGEDLVVAARRWARAEIEPEIADLRSQVTQLSSRSQQTATSLAQRTVEQVLDAEVPTWNVINNEPAFVAWLAQPDPFSGRVRHDMLTEAYAGGDGRRTANFFRAYQQEQTVVNQPARNPTHTASQPDPADRVSLEDLAAPGRGNMPSGSNGAPDRRIWSTDHIAAFYRDKQRGKFNGREAEAARLEADLFAAQTEGRIR